MSIQSDILDSLDDLGYKGPIKDESVLDKSVESGAKSVEFTMLVSWLTNEMKLISNLEDHVNPTTGPDDSSTFLLEVSSFLKEIDCPYSNLTSGPISQRLSDKVDRLKLLDFLCSELQAAKMISVNKPKKVSKQSIKMADSDTATILKSMIVSLGFPKPPNTITASQLFIKLDLKIKQLLESQPKQIKPLFNGLLSEKQWSSLEKINLALNKEYSLRRQMLLKRLDVTIQSFSWSDLIKKKEDDIARTFQKERRNLKANPNVRISDVLAATDDLTILNKTSGADERKNTKCPINKFIIGAVPDRGGRPGEQKPPPPEMPSWAPRSQTQGGRGGRVQGSWATGKGGYQQGRGGFQQGQGSFQQGQGDYRQQSGGFQQGQGSFQQGQGDYRQQSGGHYQQRGEHRGGRGQNRGRY